MISVGPSTEELRARYTREELLKMKGKKGKEVELPCYGIGLSFDKDGFGVITSDLQQNESFEEFDKYNAAMDGLESLILAHAMNGINIKSNSYIKSIRMAVDIIKKEILCEAETA